MLLYVAISCLYFALSPAYHHESWWRQSTAWDRSRAPQVCQARWSAPQSTKTTTTWQRPIKGQRFKKCKKYVNTKYWNDTQTSYIECVFVAHTLIFLTLSPTSIQAYVFSLQKHCVLLRQLGFLLRFLRWRMDSDKWQSYQHFIALHGMSTSLVIEFTQIPTCWIECNQFWFYPISNCFLLLAHAFSFLH